MVTPAAATELQFGKAGPSAKAEKAHSDYCKSLYGEGYSDFAGTGTCVKIGGRVRVDFGATNGSGTNSNPTGPAPFRPDASSRFGTAVEGAADIDSRTPVQGQTLRVFARLRSAKGDNWLIQRAPH